MTLEEKVLQMQFAELHPQYPPSPDAPIRALQGFERVRIAPGESKHLTFVPASSKCRRRISSVLIPVLRIAKSREVHMRLTHRKWRLATMVLLIAGLVSVLPGRSLAQEGQQGFQNPPKNYRPMVRG